MYCLQDRVVIHTHWDVPPLLWLGVYEDLTSRYCDQNDHGFRIIAVFFKVCSICSESTDRPAQTEIASKSETVYIIFQKYRQNLVESATFNLKGTRVAMTVDQNTRTKWGSVCRGPGHCTHTLTDWRCVLCLLHCFWFSCLFVFSFYQMFVLLCFVIKKQWIKNYSDCCRIGNCMSQPLQWGFFM